MVTTPAASVWIRFHALAVGAAIVVLALALGPALAEDILEFKVEMKNGAITPDRIDVAAGKPFRIDVTNAGSGPAEFESTELHKEKVLTAGGSGSLIFRSLSAGTYIFFDDFHPDGTKLILTVK